MVGLMTGLGGWTVWGSNLDTGKIFFSFLKRLGPTQPLLRGLLRWRKADGA